VKWLITGGCGFLGTNLIKQLCTEDNHYIRVVDNLCVGTREDLAAVCDFVELKDAGLSGHPSSLSGTELVIGNILDSQLALRVTRGVDVIVHLAANTGVQPSIQDPHGDCYTNVIGTLNYLEAARHNQVKRFIFASSGAPIGKCTPPIHEELAPHPVSPYGASKLAGEGYCCAYFHSFGVETVVLRFGNVYGLGSGHKNSVVAKFIRQALNGETLEIYGDGRQTRDFIFIDDLVRAICLAAATDNIGGEVFQIATNTETTVKELVDQLSWVMSEMGIKLESNYASPLIGDVRRNFSDTSKAKEILGWQAEVELKDGLRRTVEWFVQQRQSVTR